MESSLVFYIEVCVLFLGADPDTISSSGTEEDDFYEDENSRHSTDFENGI